MAKASTTKSTTKEDKFVIDKASGKIISAGPEEVDATQPLLEILITEAGWKAEQIVSRPQQWRVPSSPSDKRTWPVDVAIFADPKKVRDPDHVTILCECKRPDVESGLGRVDVHCHFVLMTVAARLIIA
jgi:type I restriction enzyme M protein